MDISANMLEKAANRKMRSGNFVYNTYGSLVKGDIEQKLPFPDNLYDYVICVGTTSYIGIHKVTENIPFE